MKLIDIYPLLPDEFMIYQRVQLYNGENTLFPVELITKPICEYLDFEVYQIIPSRKCVSEKNIIGIVL